MQCASAIGARVKTPLMLAAAVAVALGVQAASLVSTGTTDAFTVGCVNCGAFHYGKGRATAEEFKAEWTKLAKEWPQDVFFYEDVGKGAPGNVSQPKFDIRAAAKVTPQPQAKAPMLRPQRNFAQGRRPRQGGILRHE